MVVNLTFCDRRSLPTFPNLVVVKDVVLFLHRSGCCFGLRSWKGRMLRKRGPVMVPYQEAPFWSIWHCVFHICIYIIYIYRNINININKNLNMNIYIYTYIFHQAGCNPQIIRNEFIRKFPFTSYFSLPFRGNRSRAIIGTGSISHFHCWRRLSTKYLHTVLPAHEINSYDMVSENIPSLKLR